MDTGSASRNSRINPQRIRKSASYRTSLARAAKLLRKPHRVDKLVNDAASKASSLSKGPIPDAMDNLSALFRLLKAYGRGEYRNVPWSSLVLVVSTIVYFVTPVDLVPDFIAGLGYLDDAALITWTINAIGQELEKFKGWEAGEAPRGPCTAETAED